MTRGVDPGPTRRTTRRGIDRPLGWELGQSSQLARSRCSREGRGHYPIVRTDMATAGPIAGTVWEALADDEDGAIYYYNTATEETTWEKPEEVAAAEAAQAAEASSADSQQGGESAEENATAGAADMAAQVRAMRAKKASGDAADEEDATAGAADMAAQVRAMKAKKASGDAVDVRTQVADRAAAVRKVALGSTEEEVVRRAAAQLAAAEDAAAAAAAVLAAATEAIPDREIRVQALRDQDVAVEPQRMVSNAGLLTPVRPPSASGIGTPQLGRSQLYSLHDAQPQALYSSASIRGASSAAAAAAEAAIAAEVKAESKRRELKRHDERIAWSQGSRLGLPPAAESPMPAASPTGTFYSPSRMASRWADPELLQTARVQEMNQHLTGSSGPDSSRMSRVASRVQSPDALTENTVLRDRLLLAEGALESLRIHGEQERVAREAMHATLVASENSRAQLRNELVQSRGAQRELEAEVAELRRQVCELTAHQDFGQAR